MIKTSPARGAVVICAILCLIYALLAGSAAAQKSATYDEPHHVASSWLERWRGDYRIGMDEPALWKWWIALPFSRDAMNPEAAPAGDPLQLRAIEALYRVPPATGITLVEQGRAMSLPLAIVLAILIAFWAGQLAGRVAAVAALFAFAFDPNWLAHGPLVKNDVAIAMVFFATVYALWRVGRRITALGVIALLVLPAVCMGAKLSGLIAAPVAAICLLIRAMMKEPWTGDSRRKKLATAGLMILGIAIVSYAGIWAEYRFRFDAGLDMDEAVRSLRFQQVGAAFHVYEPTGAQLAAWRPGVLVRLVLWLTQYKLVPQAWASWFLFYRGNDAGNWKAFFLGQVYWGGRWDYFPLVWLFKEPLALIAATVLAIAIPLKYVRRLTWTAVVLTVPPVVYAAMAMHGSLNVGIRHILPVLPFTDVCIGLAAAKVWAGGRVPARIAVLLLAAGLATETLASYPDFLSFFNVACGGERGGIRLLGDSNLDWGQDLPLLADWQQQHPDAALYLDYFGNCDPAAYGIRYLGPTSPPPPPNGLAVAAVSATKLQGLYSGDTADDFAKQFEKAKPIDVLGGTIYLFDYPPRQAISAPRPPLP